jgi:maltose phosphorylase
MDEFSIDTIRHNYNFYEPKTVHQSSLSSCIHSVMASNLGEIDNAYNLYLRTSRLDLDDYNNEVSEGLHITSMAGSWLAIVEGFARKRISKGTLAFSPLIPAQWTSFSFKIKFRQHILEIFVSKDEVKIRNIHDKPIEILLFGSPFNIGANSILRYQKTLGK